MIAPLSLWKRVAASRFRDVGLNLTVDGVIGRFKRRKALIAVPKGALELLLREKPGEVFGNTTNIVKRAVIPPVDMRPAIDPMHE